MRRVQVYTSIVLILLSLLGCSNREGGEPLLLKEGVKAPDFTLPDLQGRKISLGDMAGRDTLIVFWATWCPSCKEELKVLDATYKKYGKEGFNLLAINLFDDPEIVKEYMNRNGLTFPVLLDREGAVADRYLVYAIPIGYMVDREGLIRKRFIGGIPEEEIATLLKEYWSIER